MYRSYDLMPETMLLRYFSLEIPSYYKRIETGINLQKYFSIIMKPKAYNKRYIFYEIKNGLNCQSLIKNIKFSA